MYTRKYVESIPMLKEEIKSTEDPILKLLLTHMIESIEEVAIVVEKDLKELDKRIQAMEQS